MKEITTSQFMAIGTVVFLLIGAANFLFFLVVLKTLHPFQVVSQLAGIFFNFLIAYMFIFWRKQQAAVGAFQDYKEPEGTEEALKDIFKENGKTKRKQGIQGTQETD